jgi:FtsP/CotA-like multicopper oxidase with cupredoxin domain
MRLGTPGTEADGVTEVLLSSDPAVVFLLLGVWTWAGLVAAGLPYAVDALALRRRAGLVVGLAGVGAALAALRVGLVAGLAGSGWWFVQEKVVLARPLLLVPLAATVVWALPRLLRVRRAARALPGVVSPALRQEAAHPLVAWPVQLTALGAGAGAVVLFFVSYPATPGSSFAVSVGLGLTALVVWQRLRARHARLAGAVVFPSRWSRRARAALVVNGVVLVAVLGPLAALAVAAPAVDAHADTGHGPVDLGGGTIELPGRGAVPVDRLRGAAGDGPVRSFTLTARHATLTRPNGSTVDALTYDGLVPGPSLRVTEGDTVEVTLRNADIAEGVTIHWHGYDVPNGEDGVAGVTQDAVPVGGTFTYRFVARQVGTFWYHSHQSSYEQVAAGLFGVFIVEPRAAEPSIVDIAVPFYSGQSVVTHEVPPGREVRVRVVNASNDPAAVVLRGVAARVVAIDGTDLLGPTAVTNPGLRLAAGGRADFAFTMPSRPVRLLRDGDPALTLGSGEPPGGPAEFVDLMRYGRPGEAVPTRFDRHFTLVLDQKVARVAGVPMMAYTVNGNAFPEIPAQLVRFGELVKFTVVARGYGETHPIHPHGHHVRVLSVNGVPSTGSPVWLDTFEVSPGDVWEVALRADNPGIWMDHCHNLRHAAEGMMFHLRYEGVTTPYRFGGHNHAE